VGVFENDGIIYRKSASKYRVCQKIVHFYSLMWIPPSLPMDCRAFSALTLSQATQLNCSLNCTEPPCIHSADWLREIRTELQVFFFFFFLVLSFLTYQNIAGRCVDSVSFQARSEVYQPGDRYSGRGVTGAAAREFDSQSNGR
jgi:hypothetical protein